MDRIRCRAPRFWATVVALAALSAEARAQEGALTPPRLVQEVAAVPPAGVSVAAPVVVGVELTIDPGGAVTAAVVVESGGAELDAAAVSAARQFRFEPARRGEQAIAARIRYRFRFDPPPPAPAPARGVLTGRVLGADERPLAGAVVRVRDADGREATAVGDLGGAFSLELAPGRYEVVIELDGFATASHREEVAAGQATGATYRLRPIAAAAPSAVQEIEVRGERPAREVTRRPLEQREIARIPGTNGDALRAVENMPGVARSPGLQGQLVVRGSAPDDTRVYLDGTVIPIAYHFGGFNSVIPPELLGRIQFLPGNFGPEYARAMGGVVELGIRSPARDGFHGVAQIDLVDARLVAEAPLGSSTRFLAAARRSYVDGWIGPVLEQGGTSVSTAPVYYDYQALVEQDLGSHTTGRLLVTGSDDRLALRLDEAAGDPAVSGDVRNHVRYVRVQARADSALGPGTRWLNQLAYGVDWTETSAGEIDIDVRLATLQGRSDLRHTFHPMVTGVAGVDVLFGQGDVSLLAPPIPEDGQNTGPGFARPMRRQDLTADLVRLGGYAMLELSPTRRLKLLPSVRADISSDIDDWSVAPRLSARWDVGGERHPTALKAGVGLFYQPPFLYQSFPPFGTSDLEDNRSLHVSAGVEQGLGGAVELSVEGFAKRLDRLVDQRPDATGSESGVTYVNSGSGRIVGAEMLLRYRADDRFFGWIAYTLSRSERRSDDREAYRPFDFDQTHILSALGSLRLGGGWEVGARFRYVTGSPSTPPVAALYDADAGAYAPLNGDPFSIRDGAFHQLDLRVDRTWTMDAWRFAVYLDVQNAYSRRNPEGRRYNFDYSRSEIIPGLPILPVLGIRGEL